MSFWTDMYMRHEQSIDRRQEAEHHRLVTEIHNAMCDHDTLFDQMMVSVGRRLMAWGYRLEAQHN